MARTPPGSPIPEQLPRIANGSEPSASPIPEGCKPLAGGCGATTGIECPTRVPTPEGSQHRGSDSTRAGPSIDRSAQPGRCDPSGVGLRVATLYPGLRSATRG